MKKIGIIGAMDEEVRAIIDKYTVDSVVRILDFEYNICILKNIQIIIVKSGIGKVNSAICTQLLIDRFNIDYIINTGVAGAILEQLDIGDIVISTETLQHDVDATCFGYEFGHIPRMEDYVFKSNDYLISMCENISSKNNYKHHKGRIVSGDSFISSIEKKNWIKDKFNATCVDMESGSIGHVCSVNNIPYVAIRCISDTSDDRAVMKYEDFVQIALKRSFDITDNLIKEIQQ